MSFLSNPLKYIITKILPRDNNDSAGWGPFRLPSPECDWMQEDAAIHDADYRASGEDGARRSVADVRLHTGWYLKAMQVVDPIKRCHRLQQICKYWPYARDGGLYIWRDK